MAQPHQPSAAVEVGTQVKKPHEAPQPAVAPLESTPVESLPIEPELVEPKSIEPKSVEPVPVVPKPVEQTPAMPAGAVALTDLKPAMWPQLLESLGLVGIVYNIASHCDLCSNANGSLEFVLDTGNASLFNDGHNDKIRLALENYFGHSLSVCIVPGDVERRRRCVKRAWRRRDSRKR